MEERPAGHCSARTSTTTQLSCWLRSHRWMPTVASLKPTLVESATWRSSRCPPKPILQPGDCVPTDKGFDQLSEILQELGCQMVAPIRRVHGRSTYTADERYGNKGQSNKRIHVERHFSRLQGWGFFSQKKIPLYSTDILAKTFNVVSHLCNLYQPVRNRQDMAVDGV